LLKKDKAKHNANAREWTMSYAMWWGFHPHAPWGFHPHTPH
jgi:hypothetical protein